ncbi:MAG: peptide ABC transporter substrate-binding protein [Chloroflexota bacterium]|nr:peptide ABC transporter substrate-binding protein [Dehalococcoidia bacterium]MDW8254321.1 peptide ABC transporter substrate-binding protein [Chloroflexota bacterium]
MWTTRKLLTLAAIGLFVFASNPACRLIQGVQNPGSANPPGPGPRVSREGTLTLLGGDPPTLDPATTGDATSATYIVEIFSGLLTLDRDLRVVPDLAERWEVSPDGRTYTFSIRRDAKFHDGKQVRASDFKYSWERAANPRTLSPTADTYLGDIVGVSDMLAGRAQQISGVRVIDDWTLQVTIDEPKSYFLAKLTYPTSFVVDRENIERGGRTWTDRPNGTGPFKLREWRKGQNIILERNENWYRGAPSLLRVNYILSGGSPITMYENDEIDATVFGILDAERILDPSPNNRLYREVVRDKDGQPGVAMLSTFYITFNVTKPPFDDVKIRQAMNYAVDKDRLISVVLRNMDIRADGILPPGMPGYNPQLRGYRFDPATARRLVAESRYPDLSRFDITLTTVGAGANPARYIQALTEMWKTHIGLDAKIEQVEWATFLDDQFAKKYTFFEGPGWIADYPDPQNFLDILFYSKSKQNHTGYANPEVDRLLLQARVERDQNTRLRIYQQVEQMIMDDAVWIPLFHEKQFWLVKPWVKGFVVAPMIIPTLQYISIER